MTASQPRESIKRALGFFPFSAKLYHVLRPDVAPPGAFDLSRLKHNLPDWCAAVRSVEPWILERDRKNVLIIGSLKWWVEYGVVIGLLLKAAGHSVDLAYLPYRDWTTPLSRFDILRGAHFIGSTLRKLGLPFQIRSLLKDLDPDLDFELESEIEAQACIDVQYTMQREDIDVEGNAADAALYALRLERNRQAAAAARQMLKDDDFDVVIIPNGSILEFGAIYRMARKLGIDTVTYEFGEQRQRVWLAQNDEVMRQDTSELWNAVKDIPLEADERRRIETLFQARRGGQTWEQFKRQWQAGGSEGAQKARQKLGLDPDRPMVLLCTNVVADSLALNRQVFTEGMADWLAKTVAIFAESPEFQLVVRVHPGEMLGAGHPSVEIVREVLPGTPDHVIVVPPESEINTYDLIELAHLGLVYTTTVGLEMCMHGVPVIAAGATHYRQKGFTDDPGTWDEFVEVLEARLVRAGRIGLSDEAVDAAWRYAYRFFFDYPFEIPWHLISFWDDLSQFPFNAIVERIDRYIPTLNAFVGEPIDWREKVRGAIQAEAQIER